MAMARTEGMPRITKFLDVLQRNFNPTATFHINSFGNVNKVTWAHLKNVFPRPLKAFASHCKQKMARTPASGVSGSYSAQCRKAVTAQMSFKETSLHLRHNQLFGTELGK